MIGINRTEFDEIFDDCYTHIRNFVFYKSGDIEIAEDIAQDTFMKLWERRDEIRKAKVKSLLFTIANNMYINSLRHEKVILKFESDYLANPYSGSPEDEMEYNEFNEQLQKAINDMDERYRTAFLMNRIDKLSYKEIAQNLGLTEKAVEGRIIKGKKFLRDKLSIDI